VGCSCGATEKDPQVHHHGGIRIKVSKSSLRITLGA